MLLLNLVPRFICEALNVAAELGVLFEEVGGRPHVLLLFGLIPKKDGICAGPQSLRESAHFFRRQLRRNGGAGSFTLSHLTLLGVGWLGRAVGLITRGAAAPALCRCL
jgi:hypothetical protein